MKSHQYRFWACIPACLLLYAGVQGGDPAGGSGVPSCPNGLIEGPDPIGRTCLDPTKGGKIGDSTLVPEFGADPLTGMPFILYGDMGDIAFQRWAGSGWSATEYVASTSANELDPRAFVAADGTILVTWWADGRRGGIFYAERDAVTQRWSAPVQVTSNGARPSIARVDGGVLVVFERASARGVVDLIAAFATPDGGFAEQTVRRSAGAPGLASRLHVEDGKTWVEWQAAPGSMAWSHLVGGRWTEPRAIGVTERSYKEDRRARERIRSVVVGD